ncbi:MAG TPA: hypothetical protein PK156_17340 [Polyangium sp.]|nr:hypothetical protein [Polyangium sp.]
MTRRPTPSELIWPDDSLDSELPIAWAAMVTTQVLDWMWRAFDLLRANHLARIDLTQPLEQVERDLAGMHYVEIQRLFGAETDGYATFVPVQEWSEMQTRSSASAKPPAYDFAFVCSDNQRWAWPLEAKVVSSPGALAEYLHDVNDKFVGGVAAPLVGEGAMIGYLLVSDTTTVFANIALRLNQRLESVAEFPGRAHRASRHSRTSAPDLRLHHLLMTCVD